MKTVNVTNLHPGDSLLIFSRKRVLPTEAKVRQVYRYENEIQLHTTKGIMKLPTTAIVQVP